MTGKFIVLSVAASLLFAAGCSKNRGWLSRNDYSEMQDPFMEPDGTAARLENPSSKTAGRASLDDHDAALAEGRARVPGSGLTSGELPGPAPIRQAGASNGMTENGRRTSAASYPEDVNNRLSGGDKAGTPRTDGVTSYSGPALSDFLQKRSAAARDSAGSVATGTDQLPARTVSAGNAGMRESVNPAATRAALPTISPEVESFSNFLSEKSGNVTTAAQRASQNVQDAGVDVNNFAAWAEQQNSEWSSSANSTRAAANSTRAAATTAPGQVREKAGSVFEQARQASQEMADAKLVAPEFDDIGGDIATPLIQGAGSADSASVLSKAKSPSAFRSTGDENPFSDSFEQFQSSGRNVGAGISTKPAVSAATDRSKPITGSLDESFRIDTGWKPAQLARP